LAVVDHLIGLKFGEFHKTINALEKEQIFNINTENLSKKINDWINLCNEAMVDLETPNIPKGLLENIEPYKKILDILIAIQNPNVFNYENKVEELKNILNTNLDFKENKFTFDKLFHLNDVFNKIPEVNEFNRIANEEIKFKLLIKEKTDEFKYRKLLFKYRQDSNKNDKFIFIEIEKKKIKQRI